jgi:pimeloyl-ACP methyl ester carboxylesterase
MREARRRYRETADGGIELAYDPAIGRGPTTEDDPWEIFHALGDVPLLVVRGETSDILGRDTVVAMQAMHPTMGAVEVPNRGHAPLLDEPAAVVAIDEWLTELDRR